MNIPSPCLMLVTDRVRCGPDGLVAAVCAAVDAGVDAVQFRDKDLPAARQYELALAFREITRGRCVFVVNDRLDVALAVGADGVHLPENGLPIAVARRMAPPDFILGRSVHSVSAAHEAESQGASYIALGTVFETSSKPGLTPAGVDLVQRATTGLRIPCIAIGGVNASNAASVLAAGATGIAVVSAILQSDDVPSAVRNLQASLKRNATAASA